MHRSFNRPESILSDALRHPSSRVNSRDLLHRLPQDARILLIRLRSMGDCLLLTSPVRALKSEFPGFAVSVLVEERFASCFQGNPDFPETIVVRGKGSTIAYLRAFLEAAGKRVHTFTSPHLVHFNERIRLAGTLTPFDPTTVR